MPGVVLAFSAIPALTRLTRAGMIQAMGSDYIRTARAKGLSRASILLKHALRNAAIPVVAIAAVQLGFMLGGSIVIEQVFALHGVGFLAWESIAKNDFPVVQAVVLVLAVIYVGADHAGRPDERRARSQAARRMSAARSTAGPRRGWKSAAPGSARSSWASPPSARSSRRCWCRTIRSPRISASACWCRSGWRAPIPSTCSAPTSSAATISPA